MARSVAIMGYGTRLDRRKVEELATVDGISSSQWIIRQIRRCHEDLFGPQPDQPDSKDEPDDSDDQ